MIPVVILAGGQAKRMGGGDKCLIKIKERPLLERIIETLSPQTEKIILNANGDLSRFDAFGLETARDVWEGFSGPLAGILTAMEWGASQHPSFPLIATMAGDTPFIPKDFIPMLLKRLEAEKADIAMAATEGKIHPVAALWRTDLKEGLVAFLKASTHHKIRLWTESYHCVQVDFPSQPIDPFFNINHPEDIEKAQQLLAYL